MQDKRKDYMKKQYPAFWKDARANYYGFQEYDHQLCAIIEEIRNPDVTQVLEVGIGTGYPIAGYLAGNGFSIVGIDISIDLLKESRKSYPGIPIALADVENTPFKNGAFDVTYCFHSTHYFPDLKKSILEMVRVTRKGGRVVFDLENASYGPTRKSYRKRRLRASRLLNFSRKIRNKMRHYFLGLSPIYNQELICYESPTTLNSLIKSLRKADLENLRLLAWSEEGGIEVFQEDRIRKYPKIVIVLCCS